MAATHSSTRGKRESATVRRAQAILARQLKKPGAVMNSTGAATRFLQLRLAGEEIEVFLGLFIDAQNRLIAAEELSRGTLTQTSVYPREVVKRALALNAASVIFGHNHPSGIANPSEADIALTKGLRDVLSTVGISVHDHIIVAGQSATSFLERGLPPFGCAEPKPKPAAGDATVTIPAARPKFTCLPVYQFDPGAKSADLFEHLLARVAQLRAATVMITGNGYENFANYTDIQDDYLWMIDMGLSEIQDLGHAMADAQRRERAEKA